MALVDWLAATGVTLLDVQWVTPHLASLGAVEIPRGEYLALPTGGRARAGRGADGYPR